MVLGREVDHAAAGDGGGRGDGEVRDLEEHMHLLVELDPLAVGEAEGHVVVEHGVHVLDPQRVHRPVEDDPLVVVVLRGERHRGADHRRCDAVRPLLRRVRVGVRVRVSVGARVRARVRVGLGLG